jgi:hypothetical protein
MPDLSELPDLARDVRERAVVPPYDDVLRRVRARRRRGVAGTLVAAVLVVGAIAVWQQVAAAPSAHRQQLPADSPGPVPRTDARTWRSVVDAAQADPYEVAGTDDGAIAVVWRALVQPEPTFALVIREADGTLHGRRINQPVDLTPIPGGWVGVSTARGWFIGSDGSWTDLGQPGRMRAGRPGDVLVDAQFGTWLYSPSDRAWAQAPYPTGMGTVYSETATASGRLVACTVASGPQFGMRILTSDDGIQWTDHGVYGTQGSGCVFAGSGENLSAGIRTDPNGKMTPNLVVVSHDNGATWAQQHRQWVSYLNSQVVTPDGTTLATSELGELRVLTSDGLMSRGDHREHGVLFVAGDRVYSLAYGLSQGPLEYSDDDGLTWQETDLPGME